MNRQRTRKRYVFKTLQFFKTYRGSSHAIRFGLWSGLPLYACILLLTAAVNAGPTLGGVPGLVRVPSAEFMQDGTIYAGAHIIPYAAMPYSRYSSDGLVVFGSFTFLPFLECDLRLTKMLARPASSHHTVDRSPSIRLKLLRDRGWRPSIVLGVHDIFSTVENGQARHFGATYVVTSKALKFNRFWLMPTVGYGFNLLQAVQTEFVGFFGGMKIKYAKIDNLSLCIEYDSAHINAGAEVTLMNAVNLKCSLLQLQYFSMGASMHFELFDVF